MIRDCRADQPRGWRYFASSYAPLISRILAHHRGESNEHLELVLRALRNPAGHLFQSLDPSPERWFVAQLRQEVLAQLTAREPEIRIDVATVVEALEPLTLLEKQAAWFESMGYDAARTAEMMRISSQTVEKIRGRAADLIRGKTDAWRRSILAENGLALGREAAAASSKDCLPVKAFLDILDGRTTWRNRELTDEHANRCWHCLDHFCRMIEVVALIRSNRPLNDAEAAPYWKILQVEPEKHPGWKRMFGG